MSFWYAVIAVFFVATVAAFIYLLRAFHRFRWIKNLGEKHKAGSWLICLGFLAVIGFCTYLRPVIGSIVIIHLVFFWIISDILSLFLKRTDKVYWPGLLAIVVTAIYLAAGWYLGHHVVETDYSLTTDKDLGVKSLRVVQISDSHLGCTFDGEGFARHMEKVQAVNPDLAVVTGDFVDDDSNRQDMLRSCQALGDLKTTYGVYFVFGNHDRGYGNYRDFDTQDLRDALTENGVVILQDETVEIADGVLLMGREDLSQPGRASMEKLTEDLDLSKYVIVLDHQPHDYENQARSKVDLVLSGHTHGGQMIPIGLIGELMGVNDRTYGLEKRNQTVFIVNSGISDWAIPFKTGTVAEFGVIDIQGES